MMTLQNALNSLPAKYDSYHLKLGAADGSAFFYGGTVADAKENLDEYSGALWDAAQTNRDWNEIQRLGAAAVLAETKEKLIAQILMGTALSPIEQRDWKEKLDQQNMLLKQREQAAQALQQAVANFVPLPHRTVIEQYEATPITDPDTLIFIISGSERGLCWTVDELHGNYGLHTVLAAPNPTTKRRILAECQAAHIQFQTPHIAPGARFGFLRVLRPAVTDDLQDQGLHCRIGTNRWVCLCEICGKKTVVRERELLRGHRKTCGCRGHKIAPTNFNNPSTKGNEG